MEVELHIQPGEHFVLFGPSGAGKTTIVEAIAGLVRIGTGYVKVGSAVITDSGPPYRSLPLHRRRVGLLQQDPGLFPHMTSRQNAGFARHLLPASTEVAKLAGRLGIEALLDALPGSLSGGQRQRVALARVLLSQHDVLLLDEPYTGLDASLARELTSHALELSRSVPSVMVTHDLETAQHFGDRIGILDDGRLIQVGDSHDVVLRPANRRAAELVGYRGFVATGRGVVGVHPDRVMVGAHAQRGFVLGATIVGCRPAGVAFEVEAVLASPESSIPQERGRAVFRLESHVVVGEGMEITVIDPPVFS